MFAKQNPFVWYDVMTTDTKAAEAFYAKVVGWDIKDSGMPDRYYGILFAGAAMVGGLMPIPEDARAMGAQPAWMGYIGVDDVDDYAKRVRAMGGAILRDCTDIPGVGRFAVAADPHGAGFILFKPNTDQTPAPAPMGAPGHVGWPSYTPGTGLAPSISIPVCSAGPRTKRWIWARWDSIKRSKPPTSKAAA